MAEDMSSRERARELPVAALPECLFPPQGRGALKSAGGRRGTRRGRGHRTQSARPVPGGLCAGKKGLPENQRRQAIRGGLCVGGIGEKGRGRRQEEKRGKKTVRVAGGVVPRAVSGARGEAGPPWVRTGRKVSCRFRRARGRKPLAGDGGVSGGRHKLILTITYGIFYLL